MKRKNALISIGTGVVVDLLVCSFEWFSVDQLYLGWIAVSLYLIGGLLVWKYSRRNAPKNIAVRWSMFYILVYVFSLALVASVCLPAFRDGGRPNSLMFLGGGNLEPPTSNKPKLGL